MLAGAGEAQTDSGALPNVVGAAASPRFCGAEFAVARPMIVTARGDTELVRKFGDAIAQHFSQAGNNVFVFADTA